MRLRPILAAASVAAVAIAIVLGQRGACRSERGWGLEQWLWDGEFDGGRMGSVELVRSGDLDGDGRVDLLVRWSVQGRRSGSQLIRAFAARDLATGRPWDGPTWRVER